MHANPGRDAVFHASDGGCDWYVTGARTTRVSSRASPEMAQEGARCLEM